MSNISNLISRIKLLYDLKKYDLAIQVFKSETALMDDDDALYHIGRCYKRLGKHREALALFERALELDAESGSVKLELAKHYTDRDSGKAIDLVWQCIESNPLEPAYWGVLGSIYFSQEKFKEAEETFHKYLEMKPNDVRSITNLAVCKNEQGKDEEAEALYKKSIAIDPNYTAAYFNLAVHYSDKRELKKAEEIYFDTLRMNPNNANSVYGLACVYAVDKQLEKAFDFLQKSIEMSPEYKTYVLTDVDFEELKQHPRFRELTEF